MSYPPLLPELHPMCGKLMIELKECWKVNEYSKFRGACNEYSYELSKCLKKEKLEARAPRLQKFQERWNERKEKDKETMEALDRAGLSTIYGTASLP
mmetsp:Transcript_29345/g.53845  ORF Transcript_29345/g.53845 Transcript_29345/m.53845 type:complete len:97 (+) Transcript_29345:90-380(+)